MGIAQLFKNPSTHYAKPETVLRESPFLSKMARMPTFREALPALSAEMNRARRYQRPLSMAVVQFEESAGSVKDKLGISTGNSAHGDGLANCHPACYPELLVALLLGAILKDSLRATDLLSYDTDTGWYVIMMPELTGLQAHRAAERLNRLVLTRIFTPIRVGIAQFPRDGLTLEELVTASERNCSAVVSLNLAAKSQGAGA
jgi:hypothetical protein